MLLIRRATIATVLLLLSWRYTGRRGGALQIKDHVSTSGVHCRDTFAADMDQLQVVWRLLSGPHVQFYSTPLVRPVCAKKKKKRNHRSRQPRREWASALEGAGTGGQHRATPTRAAALEAPPATLHRTDSRVLQLRASLGALSSTCRPPPVVAHVCSSVDTQDEI